MSHKQWLLMCTHRRNYKEITIYCYYWLHCLKRALMTTQRDLLDSLTLEGHEALGERGVDAREVCVRDV